MMQHFGSGKTAQEWAKWPDGSMMRFMPFLPPTSNQKNLEKIKDMMSFQIYTKATETVRDIEVYDIFTPQSYLQGRCFQEVVLEIESDTYEGIPVFKHLIRRWTFNPIDTKYALTSYASMSSEADKKALGLMDILFDKYGKEVLRHFGGASILESHQHNKRTERGEEVDPLLEAMLMETSIKTDTILEPGCISLLESEDIGFQGGSTIDLSLENTNMEGNEVKSDSGDVSKLTDGSDDVTVITGTTYSDVSKTTRKWKRDRMLARKLEEINSSMEDVESWKLANPKGVAILKSVANGDKEKLTLSIIRVLRDESNNPDDKPPTENKEQLQRAPEGS
jgi:hypothetical protein